MTRLDLVNWIKTKLGYPVVNLELTDEMLSTCIDDALDEVNPWLPQEHVITIPVTGTCIDLTEHKVGTIVHIYKSPDDDVSADDGSIDPFTYKNYNLTDMSIVGSMLEQQRLGYYKDNMSYKLIGNKLYMDPGLPIPRSVTIEYYKDEYAVDVEDYTDRRYLKFLKDFSLAFARGMLGDIRGKFTASNSPVSLDGDSQDSKSQSELERLRQLLKDASNPTVFISD